MVEFDELNSGDLLQIKGEEFEVMKVIKKSNPSPKPGATLQFYLLVEMKKKNNPQIFPTTFIKYYPDTGNILLIDNKKLEDKDITLKK